MKNNTLSFVIPAMNEEATIAELFHGIRTQTQILGKNLEVIFVDDGSTDSTWKRMQALANAFPGEVKAVKLRANVGKARALAVGFERATGDIVFTMDADLQDDPLEIPRFLEKLAEGYDLVSGYKQTRHDPWHKVLPSRVFNAMVSKLNGVQLHDHNCGFKCYRAEVVKAVKLQGEMHRMIPCLASIEGYRSSEIVVTHHARQHGVSKYGIKRFARGFFDMLTVHFLKNYKDRPMHLFGGLAAIAAIVGCATAAAGLGQLLSSTNEGLALLSTAFASGSAALVLASIGLTNELAISGKGGELNTPIAIETPITMLPKIFTPNVAKSPAAPAFKTRTAVLRVDDPAHRETYLHHLEDAHFEALIADDWRAAFLLAQRFDATIFTDKSQGHISHDSLFRNAINRSPNTKLVFCNEENERLYFGKYAKEEAETSQKLIPFPIGHNAA